MKATPLSTQAMTFGSLFSGIGGCDRGLERAGHKALWMVESDKQCRRVLARHWPDVDLHEDVHDVGADELDRVDLICGGFPCQDYSVAGKRGGLAGDRGALWWQMHRIVAELRPTWVLAENVPGLLSSNGGRDFLTIIGSLVQLGYGVCWATLDSQYWGVAQRRRRLFIVGHSGGVARPEVLAIAEGLSGHPAPSREAGQRVAALTAHGVGTCGADDNQAQAGHIIAHTLTAEGFDASEDGTGRGTPIVAQTLTAEMYRSVGATAGNNPGVRNVILFDPTQVTSKENRSNPQPGDPCHPLAAQGHAPLLTTAVPRRLTPMECCRLQAFPDDWLDGCGLKDEPRYRMLGNAVTVTVAEWIGQRILESHDTAKASR